jgi:uroporphyrinogen-III decarboxylase
MSRQTFHDFARRGLAMPLAVDLLVHLESTPEKVDANPAEMARIMIRAAEVFDTPLAVAPMDLRVEKAALAEWLGIPAAEHETFHLSQPLSFEQIEALRNHFGDGELTARMRVTAEALGIAAKRSALIPTGMAIGPFSLVTKIMEDVITAVFMVGAETDPDEDESVALALQLIELTTGLVEAYVRAQIAGGAKAIIICEPAANKVYFSPKQIAEGSNVFERMVIEPNRRIVKAIEEAGADLILHDCGELTPEMIADLAGLHPVVLSLGSCVDIVEATRHVPRDVVLFGTVPSKFVPREDEMPVEKVRAICASLRDRMEATGHPFILGSECDVLCVHGHERGIMAKAREIAECSHMKRVPG